MPTSEGICNVCSSVNFKTRSDDIEDAVKTRLMMYEESTAPILDFFTAQRLNIAVIDGMQPMDDVFYQIENILNIE